MAVRESIGSNWKRLRRQTDWSYPGARYSRVRVAGAQRLRDTHIQAAPQATNGPAGLIIVYAVHMTS